MESSLPPMRRIVLVSLWLLFSLPAAAVEVPGLFTVSVPVSGQGAEEREGALYAAFSRLLVRIGSGRGMLEDERALALLQRAPRFMEQYRYRQTPESLVLEVRFDPRAVERALLEQGLPLWGHTRPLTLAWVVVQEGGQRRLINEDNAHSLLAAMRRESAERALPLSFPLLDLEDQMALSVTDVWGGFVDRIMAASARYGAEAVLVGRLYRDLTTHRWQGRWFLLEGGRVVDRWVVSGPLDWVAAEGVARTADVLAARYAQRLDRSEGVRLWVTGVTGLADYARVQRYVEGLTVVERVQPVEVDGGRLALELRLRGEVGALVQAFALGGVLVPAATASERAETDVLEYRLLPP